MQVIRTQTAGFCMGVDLALNKLNELVQYNTQNKPIYTLGPIIHNPQVLHRYAQQGVLIADTPQDIPSGSTCLIRAHGVPKNKEKLLEQKHIKIIDATCPRVKKAQLLIQRECSLGRQLLLYGEAEHPEVAGLLSYASTKAQVFGTLEELQKFSLKTSNTYVLAAQTTQDQQIFTKISENLQHSPELDITVLHTICDATKDRQNEAVKLAKQVEYMVIVGGYSSGNTRRLVQVCRDVGTPCVHIETHEELPFKELKKISHIGLTAGASTPADIIDAVQHALYAL